MTAKRTTITGPAIPMRGNDIDTDRIIPARFLKCVVFDGLGEHAFEDDRAQQREAGTTHPFDDPRFAAARILVVNRNFGCGSSREHAPQSLMRWGHGIEAVIGESFAEIFAGNCLALGVPTLTCAADDLARLQTLVEEHPETPVEIDIERRVATAGDLRVPVDMADGPRHQLLAGTWDTTGELVSAADATRATADALPYVRGWQ